MAKIKKDEQLRREGVLYALSFIEKKGLDAFIADCKWRGISAGYKKPTHPDVPLKISRGQYDEFMITNKEICVATIGIMAAMTLHDEFGFGHERINKFLKRFNSKTDVLEAPELTETTWKDYQDILMEECGIDIAIPGYDEDTNEIRR